MKNLLTLLLLLTTLFSVAQNISYKDAQIKSALYAAPEEKKENAKVYGYDDNNNFVVLRNGSGDMVCIADDPEKGGINISCYHKDLEPFMARGRELKKEGKGYQEIFDQREAEVQAKKLKMPDQPSALFVLSAKDEDLNRQTGEINNPYLRYVVYVPYETSESTGLPLGPTVPGMPWIMNPGTHRAHIMITPPANPEGK